ncbi:TetR/AcrR family transcriptional regulator [Blastococcus sp. SYSU DS0539]
MTDSSDYRRRRWEATHERIFAAAVQLFEDEGFDQVSVGSIATAAGVSVPTFYAHYPSKEHLVMRLAAPEEVAALIAAQPAELPLAVRIRRAAVDSLSGIAGEDRAQLHARWQIIAGSPALRHRAGEFDRITATMAAEALAEGGPPRTADLVVASAYLAAYTTGLLVWADSGDETALEQCVEAAFEALEQARSVNPAEPGAPRP